ncbi:MAG TPA: hypothetical protein VFD74_06955, partial [Thermoleophilia bacterium]|nr:hypothetical protein [Thermoleophilia bacterium]
MGRPLTNSASRSTQRTPHIGRTSAACQTGAASRRCKQTASPKSCHLSSNVFAPVFPGAVGRTPGLWSTYLADPEHEREGASALFHVVHRGDDGSADGYVSYRVKSDWVGGIPDSTLIVHDVLAPGPEVYAALWRYCLDVDLVATVSTVWAPVDEPLRWLLADPRRLRVNRLNDGLWLRILDVPAALAAREYGGGHGGGRGESGDGAQGRAGGDALVLDIADAFRPATAGRYLLEAGPDGAACCRTMRP